MKAELDYEKVVYLQTGGEGCNGRTKEGMCNGRTKEGMCNGRTKEGMCNGRTKETAHQPLYAPMLNHSA
jgi:hypothetical protein